IGNATSVNSSDKSLNLTNLRNMAAALANASGSFDISRLGDIAKVLWSKADSSVSKLFEALIGYATNVNPSYNSLYLTHLRNMAAALANASGSFDISRLGDIAKVLWSKA